MKMRIFRIRNLCIAVPLSLGSLLLWANLEVRGNLNASTAIDRVIIEKAERKLYLIDNGITVKSYSIALGRNPDGPKERQGDMKTPEGIYTVEGRNDKSSYHLALHLSYPNSSDRKKGRTGGDIMIHGLPNGRGWIGKLHRFVDWTKGCIAVTDAEIEEIWRVVPDGVTVEILP